MQCGAAPSPPFSRASNLSADPGLLRRLCDTQYGMFRGNAGGVKNWAEEEAMAELAVKHINRLR